MTCADCVHYRAIGYTYGNCEIADNHAVKFDESCEREAQEKAILGWDAKHTWPSQQNAKESP